MSIDEAKVISDQLNDIDATFDDSVSTTIERLGPEMGKEVAKKKKNDDPKRVAFNIFYQEAHDLYVRGEFGSLASKSHMFLLLLEMVATGSLFFSRIFSEVINPRGSYGTYKDMTALREGDKALCRTIWLRALSLLETECKVKGIPTHVFFNNTKSYDNGVTLYYYGAGVPITCDVLRSRSEGKLPEIQVTDDYLLLVDPSNVSPASKILCGDSKSNKSEEFTLEKASNVMCTIDNEAYKGEKFVRLGVKKAVSYYGISGSFRSTIGGVTEIREVVYTVPHEIRTRTKAHKALNDFPREFLKRKLRNLCYKTAYMDVLNIEDTEERVIVNTTGVNEDSLCAETSTRTMSDAIESTGGGSAESI